MVVPILRAKEGTPAAAAAASQQEVTAAVVPASRVLCTLVCAGSREELLVVELCAGIDEHCAGQRRTGQLR